MNYIMLHACTILSVDSYFLPIVNTGAINTGRSVPRSLIDYGFRVRGQLISNFSHSTKSRKCLATAFGPLRAKPATH